MLKFILSPLDIADDLDGLASLVMACDEIVSIDNSVVHLLALWANELMRYCHLVQIGVGARARMDPTLVSVRSFKSTAVFWRLDGCKKIESADMTLTFRSQIKWHVICSG